MMFLIFLFFGILSWGFASFNFDLHAGGKYIVLPVHRLGMANRLRIISSIYSISRSTRRKLIVVWNPSFECSAAFGALFMNISTKSIVVVNSNVVESEFETYIKQYSMQVSEQANLSFGSMYPRSFFVSLDDKLTADVLLLWTLGTHTSDLIDCHGYNANRRLFYDQLAPSPAVARRINTVRQAVYEDVEYDENIDVVNNNGQYWNGEIVGVHIRAHDVTHDWSAVPPSPMFDPENNTLHSKEDTEDNPISDSHNEYKTAGLEALRFDEAAPFQSFIQNMMDILNHSPSTLFLVSSNSAAARQELIRLFGAFGKGSGSVIMQHVDALEELSSVSDRSTPLGMILATVDFFLLGNLPTKLLMHTRGSSFASEAAMLHRHVKVVDVSSMPAEPFSVNIVSGYDANHMLCGLNEYIRENDGYWKLRLNAMGHTVNPVMEQSTLLGVNEEGDSGSTGSTERGDAFCYEEEDRRMCTMKSMLYPFSLIAQPQERQPGFMNPKDLLLHDEFLGLRNVYGLVRRAWDTGMYSDGQKPLLIVVESNGYSLS